MKRLVLFLALLAAAFAVYAAHDFAVQDFYATGHDPDSAPRGVAATTATPAVDQPAQPISIELQAGQVFGSGPQVSQEFAIQNPRLREGTYGLVNASCRCKGAFPQSFEVAADGSSRVGISFVANSEDAVHGETIEATYATTRSGITTHAKLRCTGTVIPEYAIRWDEAVKSVGKVQAVVTIRKLTGSAWSSYGLQGDQLEITELDRSEAAFEHYDEMQIRADVKDTSEMQRVSQRTLAIHVDGKEKWTGEVTIVDRRRIESDPPKVFMHAVDGQPSQRTAKLTSAVPCRVLSVESDHPEIRVVAPAPPDSPNGVLSTVVTFEYVPDPSESASTGLRVIQAKVHVRVSCREDLVEIPVVVLDNRRSKKSQSTEGSISRPQ